MSACDFGTCEYLHDILERHVYKPTNDLFMWKRVIWLVELCRLLGLNAQSVYMKPSYPASRGVGDFQRSSPYMSVNLKDISRPFCATFLWTHRA